VITDRVWDLSIRIVKLGSHQIYQVIEVISTVNLWNADSPGVGQQSYPEAAKRRFIGGNKTAMHCQSI
jgi:hypothetical protein